mgnify:FL=1
MNFLDFVLVSRLIIGMISLYFVVSRGTAVLIGLRFEKEPIRTVDLNVFSLAVAVFLTLAVGVIR